MNKILAGQKFELTSSHSPKSDNKAFLLSLASFVRDGHRPAVHRILLFKNLILGWVFVLLGSLEQLPAGSPVLPMPAKSRHVKCGLLA